MHAEPIGSKSRKKIRLPIQTSLKIGQPGDKYEQEADRVADYVIRSSPSESIQMQTEEEEDELQMKCENCEEEELQMKPQLQFKNRTSFEASPEVSNKINSSKGNGSALPPALQHAMSSKIGADFNSVNIHTGSDAIQMNKEIGARAFTQGNDIYFNSGEYQPSSSEGKHLLAHELTHVVQQKGTKKNRKIKSNKSVISKVEITKSYIQRQPISRRNNADLLVQAVSIEQLFELYATNRDEFIIGASVLRDPPIYTKPWIRGSGEQYIQDEITRRLNGVSNRRRIQLLNFIDSMHPRDFSSSRKVWLQDQVGATLPLTVAERAELRRLAGDRLSQAYTDFCSAADANARAIREAVNAEVEMYSLVLSIFMGFAAPGISRGIASLANSLPANASNAAYRVSLAALNTERTTQILNSATEIGKNLIRSNATRLFGETDTDVFIRGLKQDFRMGIDAVNGNLINLTDQELGVVAATYAPSVSNEAHYIPIIQDYIRRFREQILPIGRRGIEQRSAIEQPRRTKTAIVWVTIGRRTVLVLATEVERSHRLRFEEWIDADFKEVALNRARQIQTTIHTVSRSAFSGMPSNVPVDVAER